MEAIMEHNALRLRTQQIKSSISTYVSTYIRNSAKAAAV